MPEQVRRAFVQTFSKLNERVIWKWEKDEGMPDLPPNVKLVKWVPQQDLLGHPNIRLFITHGGLLSTEEAVYHGVPVLGLPVFGIKLHLMGQFVGETACLIYNANFNNLFCIFKSTKMPT